MVCDTTHYKGMDVQDKPYVQNMLDRLKVLYDYIEEAETHVKDITKEIERSETEKVSIERALDVLSEFYVASVTPPDQSQKDIETFIFDKCITLGKINRPIPGKFPNVVDRRRKLLDVLSENPKGMGSRQIELVLEVEDNSVCNDLVHLCAKGWVYRTGRLWRIKEM